MNAKEMSEFLGDELVGPLSVPADGAGEDSTDGGSRKLVVNQLESLRLKVLTKSLIEQQDRSARQVWSWPNRDKLQHLGCYPFLDLTLDFLLQYFERGWLWSSVYLHQLVETELVRELEVVRLTCLGTKFCVKDCQGMDGEPVTTESRQS